MMRHNRSGFWGAKAEIGMAVLCGCPGLPTLAGNFFNTTLSAHCGHGRNDPNDPSKLIVWNSEFFNQYMSMLHPIRHRVTGGFVLTARKSSFRGGMKKISFSCETLRIG